MAGIFFLRSWDWNERRTCSETVMIGETRQKKAVHSKARWWAETVCWLGHSERLPLVSYQRMFEKKHSKRSRTRSTKYLRLGHSTLTHASFTLVLCIHTVSRSKICMIAGISIWLMIKRVSFQSVHIAVVVIIYIALLLRLAHRGLTQTWRCLNLIIEKRIATT